MFDPAVSKEERYSPWAALAISLALHLTFVFFYPSGPEALPPAPLETIVVDLLQTDKSPAELSVNLPAAEPEPPQPPAAQPMQAVATPAPPANKERPARKPEMSVPKINLSDSTPLPDTADDMEVMEMTSYLPDPTGKGVSEATLNMNNLDERYRGFVQSVRSAVSRKWNSREALLAAKKSGTVTLRFTLVAGGGGSSEVQVLKSSGSPILDQEAVRAVQAARNPPFPAHWTLQRVNLIGEFQYALSGGE